MTHLPQHTSHDAATKDDIALLDSRFDRMEDRFDRMEDRMDQMQRNFLTVSFGTLTAMTAIFAFITRI
jgi:Mg2+ and Co2+ transporter CorA